MWISLSLSSDSYGSYDHMTDSYGWYDEWVWAAPHYRDAIVDISPAKSRHT